MVSRYPGIVKDMVEQGNEVGIHTFTHVDLSYQSDARIQREMEQTQLALAGAAGITTTLFRAPYSSETDAIDNYSWPVYKKLGADGLHQCLRRHRQRRLEEAGRLEDRQVGHAVEERGRLGADARRGRRP